MSDDIARFDVAMDGSIEPSEHGRWVRYYYYIDAIAARDARIADLEQAVIKLGEIYRDVWTQIEKATNQ